MDQAFLEFTRGGLQQTVTLDSGRFTLGRIGGNDLIFPEDATVSGHHAVIERLGDSWLIRDLNSANGTSVNGQRISGPQLLGSGDSILLGQTQLAFRVARRGPSHPAMPTSGEYFDVTEEWEPVGTPAVSAQSTGSPQDWTARPAAPGFDQAAPGNAQQDAEAGAGTSRDKIGVSRHLPGRHGRDLVRGTARGVNLRDNSILSFRIERYGTSGDRLPPVGAELVGLRTGQLSDGEEVEVFGRWSHGTLRATKIINLTTGAQVQGLPESARVAGALVFTFIIVVTIVFIVVFIIVVVKVRQ